MSDHALSATPFSPCELIAPQTNHCRRARVSARLCGSGAEDLADLTELSDLFGRQEVDEVRTDGGNRPGRGGLELLNPEVRQPGELAPTVGRVRLPPHPAVPLQAVDRVGQAAGRVAQR